MLPRSGSTATKTDMVFKVTLSNPTELGAVTLRYATENGEAAAPAAPAAPVRAEVIAAGSEPLTGLKLLGPVQYERVEAHRAATATYSGYMAELENVRNALRAWTLTQGEDAIGRPYEIYKNGIDAAFTADGQYDVYWGIK